MKEIRESITFPVITYPYQIFYADTDAGGVVYYAQYLRMFEQARGLYVEEFGMSLQGLVDQNCLFVCHRAELDYHAPARLDDRLEIKTRISECGGTFLTFTYEIFCTNRRDKEDRPIKIVTGITKMVCCKERNGEIVPCRIPAEVLQSFKEGPVSFSKKS